MAAALVALSLLAIAVPAAAAETWILIDTAVHRLDVYRGYELIERYRNIALGRNGTSRVRVRGDATTPLGEFRINRINRNSRFHIFLGIDYPTLPIARRAVLAGKLDYEQYFAFEHALMTSGIPPQNTSLGGDIGIHGIGAGDPEIHRLFDWTDGCIALTNEQIERLARKVKVGTRVFIR